MPRSEATVLQSSSPGALGVSQIKFKGKICFIKKNRVAKCRLKEELTELCGQFLIFLTLDDFEKKQVIKFWMLGPHKASSSGNPRWSRCGILKLWLGGTQELKWLPDYPHFGLHLFKGFTMFHLTKGFMFGDVLWVWHKYWVHFLLGATTLSLKTAARPVVIRICFLADCRHHIYLRPRATSAALMTLESLES